MFDIGFSELILVFIVGLIVLGPQRMPVAIRTVMKWVRTIRGLAANVQNELTQELKLQELQESIKKAESLNLKSLSPELAQTVEDLKQSADKMKSELEQQAQVANKTLQEQIKETRELNYSESATVNSIELNAEEKNSENLTALDSVLSPAELAEQAEVSLDEQLAKYIDQYHPTDNVQATSPSTTEKTV